VPYIGIRQENATCDATWEPSERKSKAVRKLKVHHAREVDWMCGCVKGEILHLGINRFA